MGHGARGLQRRRRGVGLLSRTTTPAPGLPVGRGRAGRASATSSSGCAWPRVVERARPDPQGAHLRVDRRRGEPRRGRQGILVVPRRRAQPRLEPLALPLPAARRSRTRTCATRTAGAASSIRSTSCSTPAPSTTTGTGSSRCDYAKADPTDLLMRCRSPTPARTPTSLHVLPTAWFRNTWSWDVDGATRPTLAADRRPERSPSHHPFLGELELLAGAGPDGAEPDAAVLRERDQHRAPVRRSGGPRRTPRTASTTTSCPARPTRQPGASAARSARAGTG